MKWLFAILVALNIVVFGSMVAGKLVHINATPATTPASTSADTENTAPTPSISVGAASSAATSSSTRTEPTTTTDKRPEEPKNKTDAAAPAPVTTAAPAANCSATAVLPEDDYHRIKGLLERWPHAATRFVEKNNGPARSSTTRYMVTIGNDYNADTRSRLQSQGFNYALIQGKVSLGVFNHKKDADSLVARAKINGFGDAQTESLGGNSDNSASLSVAKMRVVFSQVDDQAAKDINAVIQRYGRLQRSSCR